jgi:hypothetical protein
MTLRACHITCSECGVEKKQTNHWWIAFIATGARLIHNMPRSIEIREWNDNDALIPNAHHICGEGCLGKVLSRFCKSIWTPPPGTPFQLLKAEKAKDAA